LIDDLMAELPRSVLDVGCGTGKVGRLFVDRGCDVVGVEPDLAMAAFARRHDIAVDVVTFEEWDANGRVFDLLVSGQAWHWIDPDVGVAKAAAVLRPCGHFAAFWNHDSYDPEVRDALADVYRELAPELLDGSRNVGATAAMLGLAPGTGQEIYAAALRANPQFRVAETRRYAWTHAYSTAQWLDRIQTHSDHSTLAAPQLERLLAALRAKLDELGGRLVAHYVTSLVTACRVD
jgi:SAM-dependent methyltransferase